MAPPDGRTQFGVALSLNRALKLQFFRRLIRRGRKAVDSGGLENRYRPERVSWVRIPPSANQS